MTANTTLIDFNLFKQDFGLIAEGEDFFHYNSHGATESDFVEWLNKQRMFARFNVGYTALYNALLPVKKWSFFIKMYELQVKKLSLRKQYPDGWFEAVSEHDVACFLPDTYGAKPFRVSVYGENGPRFHEVFDSREDALDYLSRGEYKVQDGALERIVGTDKWDRGLYVARWLSEGIHPNDGLKSNYQNSPEIQKLFAVEIAHFNLEV